MNLEHFRREYKSKILSFKQLKGAPIEQFKTWLDAAIQSGHTDPTAMVLGTVSKQGKPRQRIVLLKDYNAEGFVFYTNYNSKKSRDITNNNFVSLLFPWNSINRQIIICGRAAKVPAITVSKYFHSRPRNSQLAAWSSHQSQPVKDRQTMDAEYAKYEQKFSGKTIPVPDFWGGFQVKPDKFQFWQGQENRLHDRFEYKLKSDKTWRIRRLYP